MRKIPALKFILDSLIASAILLFFLNPSTSFASHKVFQDNFNTNSEGSFPSGWILVNDPDRTPCAASWKVHDGMAGIAIVNQGSCTTNIMPNDTVWNNLGDNYIFEFDMKFVNGTDHNVAFRFTPSFPSNNWYDLHFQSPGDFIIERVGGTYNTFVAGSYPNGKTYHLKIVVSTKNIKVFIDNTLVRDLAVDIDGFPTGRIALRAGTGADPNSETYFDNIVVTNIDEAGGGILPVPYFSQNALPWGPSEYDSAASLGIPSPTMDRWGCAVTSAAMILKYHGMDEFTNGDPMNPGNLNHWLDNNNGYQKRHGSSAIFWSSIQRLSKELFNAGKSNVKLVHSGHKPNVNTTNLLNNDLTTEEIPHLLQVNTQWGSHYVVAKGISNNGYFVNDPEWNYPDLTSFTNNSYQYTHRYLPSQTNFSYIEFVADPNVEVLVTDSQGRRTGKKIVNGQTQEFTEIPNADYYFEPPIGNPNEEDLAETLGFGVNRFLLPEPTNGRFTLIISSNQLTTYTLNIAALQENSTDTNFTSIGFVSPGNNVLLSLDYSQASPSSMVNRTVALQSAIDDINFAWELGLITKKHLMRQLIRVLNHAKEDLRRNHINVALHRLDQFERILNREREDGILGDAYPILLYDITYLKTHL
jgi:hypothetical protein